MNADPPRLAIITGAAGGLGRAFYRQVIAAPGRWHIVAIDLDEAGCRQALDEISKSRQSTGEVATFDVADGDAWLALRTRLQREWPRLDLLVNNAGVCMSAEVGDGELAAWRRVCEVNYLGVLNACHVMAPWLKQSAAGGDGRKPTVINVASIMGLIPSPALGAYSASKAAVTALSAAMHAELRPHGVNVTVAAPGFFASALLERGAFASDAHRRRAEELVRTSRIDADAVARETLRRAARGNLYAVMGRRARWYWRVQRMAPARLAEALSRRYRRMMVRDSNEA